MISKTDREYIKRLDFYRKIDTSEWADHHNYKYKRMRGEYPLRMPQCSVVIRTYKRPQLLMRAVNSVLHQKGFDDYIILIVDNAGEGHEESTDTSRAVEKLKDARIVYYRSEGTRPTNTSGLNAAANLVQTEFFVFLNDDDVFHECYLKIMMDIMNDHNEIDALMCKQKWLYEKSGEDTNFSLEKNTALCRKVDFSESIMSLRNNTTGVLYKTSVYRDVGGTIEYNLGCNDVIMSNRFDFYYNQYYLDLELHGICVRDNSDQLSRHADYYRNFYSSYYWRKDGLRKFYHLPGAFVEGIVQRRLRNNIDGLLESCWGIDISEKVLFDMLGIVPWKEKSWLTKKIYNLFGRIWDCYIKYTVDIREKRGFTITYGEN